MSKDAFVIDTDKMANYINKIQEIVMKANAAADSFYPISIEILPALIQDYTKELYKIDDLEEESRDIAKKLKEYADWLEAEVVSAINLDKKLAEEDDTTTGGEDVAPTDNQDDGDDNPNPGDDNSDDPSPEGAPTNQDDNGDDDNNNDDEKPDDDNKDDDNKDDDNEEDDDKKDDDDDVPPQSDDDDDDVTPESNDDDVTPESDDDDDDDDATQDDTTNDDTTNDDTTNDDTSSDDSTPEDATQDDTTTDDTTHDDTINDDTTHDDTTTDDTTHDDTTGPGDDTTGPGDDTTGPGDDSIADPISSITGPGGTGGNGGGSNKSSDGIEGGTSERVASSSLLSTLQKGMSKLTSSFSPTAKSGQKNLAVGALTGAGLALGAAGIAGGLYLARGGYYTFTPEDWDATDALIQQAIINDFMEAGMDENAIEDFKNSTFRIKTSELNEHIKKVEKAYDTDHSIDSQFADLYHFTVIDSDGEVDEYLLFLVMAIDGMNADPEYNFYNILNPYFEEDDINFIYTGINLADYLYDTEGSEEIPEENEEDINGTYIE